MAKAIITTEQLFDQAYLSHKLFAELRSEPNEDIVWQCYGLFKYATDQLDGDQMRYRFVVSENLLNLSDILRYS